MVAAGFDIHTILLTFVGTGGVVKLGLMAIRSMPPPPATCGFWCRWFFDFVQLAAENQDKVGKTQAAGQPIGVEQPTATISKVVVDTAVPDPNVIAPVAQKAEQTK